MNFVKQFDPGIPELLLFVTLLVIFPPILVYMAVMHVIDYKILKNRHMRGKKYDLNISCGNTDGGGINADIVKRNVPNFVLVKDIYNLPFKDNQFKETLCSHTMEHVEDPDKFYAELERVSKNVTLLVPPLWDILALFDIGEHKWQFLSSKIVHRNNLPRRVKLPYWGYQKKYGQKIRC